MFSTPDYSPRQSVLEQVLASALDLLNGWESDKSILPVPFEIEQRPAVGWLLDQFFRNLGIIDWTLGRLCDFNKTRRQLLHLLRLACCHILYQNNLPPPVVVDTCVRLGRARFSGREAGFVNAVLRRLLRENKRLAAVPFASLPPVARFNLGRDLLGQWEQHLQPAEISELAALARRPPPLLVRQRGAADDKLFGADSILRPLAPFPWAEGERFLQCLQPRRFFTEGWTDRGCFYVQDPATALAVSLMQVVPGESIADLCAAPGGKSVMMLERLSGQGLLLSSDRDRMRMQWLADNLGGAENAVMILSDAARSPLAKGVWHGVLIDVPCSNTGVLRRRPEVKWRFSRRVFQRLLVLQSRILSSAAVSVAPGGRLVYSTCSIEPEENGGQVRKFLRRHPDFRLEKEQLLMPAEWNDGAYAARLRRVVRQVGTVN